MKVRDLNVFLIAQVMHKVDTTDVINAFQCIFTTNRNIHSHETRQSDHLSIPLYHKNLGKTSIRYRGAVIWNNVLKVELHRVAHKLHSSNSLKLKYQLGILKTSYINHHDITLRDHVLCCQYMELFYSMKFGYDLVYIGADYLLHI